MLAVAVVGSQFTEGDMKKSAWSRIAFVIPIVQEVGGSVPVKVTKGPEHNIGGHLRERSKSVGLRELSLFLWVASGGGTQQQSLQRPAISNELFIVAPRYAAVGFEWWRGNIIWPRVSPKPSLRKVIQRVVLSGIGGGCLVWVVLTD